MKLTLISLILLCSYYSLKLSIESYLGIGVGLVGSWHPRQVLYYFADLGESESKGDTSPNQKLYQHQNVMKILAMPWEFTTY
jgi:hypothetical protein